MKFSTEEILELTTSTGGLFAVNSLLEAELFCKKLATSHYENFPVGSLLIPEKFRKHFFSVYAFSRIADDLADELIQYGKETQLAAINDFEKLLFEKNFLSLPKGNPVFTALHQTMKESNIPPEVLARLLVAFRMDVNFKRPVTMQDNLDYCHYSANPVGELVLRIFGLWNQTTAPYSDSICTGLQLANFWQDISRDFEKGRIYIPSEIMEHLHSSAKDNLQVDKNIGNFPATIQYLCKVTEVYFASGETLIGFLPYFRLRFEIALTIEGGRAILRKTKRLGSTILFQRPSITGFDMLIIFVNALLRYSIFWRKYGK
ncbi:MAG: squalene/phytoene synthase family protein [Ignavibacteriae bacterium]|nr:squalene/phytoene synthase family protein [Ignavibacteriota bacterium]